MLSALLCADCTQSSLQSAEEVWNANFMRIEEEERDGEKEKLGEGWKEKGELMQRFRKE